MTPIQRSLLWGSTVATTLSGVAYFWMKYPLELPDPWAVANHPLQPLMLKLHILTAPVMLFAVGVIFTNHVWRHIRSRLPRGRQTGVLSAVVFGPLVLSGYLIQAAAPGLLSVVTWAHVGLGVACAGGLLLHWRMVRGRRPARRGALPVVSVFERESGSGPEDVPARITAAAAAGSSHHGWGSQPATARAPIDARFSLL